MFVLSSWDKTVIYMYMTTFYYNVITVIKNVSQ